MPTPENFQALMQMVAKQTQAMENQTQEIARMRTEIQDLQKQRLRTPDTQIHETDSADDGLRSRPATSIAFGDTIFRDPRNFADLRRYLRSRHPFERPVDRFMSQPEYETRLHGVQRFHQAARQYFCMRLVYFSIFMQAPLLLFQETMNQNIELIYRRMMAVSQLLTCFCGGPGHVSKVVLDPLTEYDPRDKVGRNEPERQNVLTRDYNTCIITGAEHPEVCHIVPFSWTSSTKNRDTVQRVLLQAQNLILPADVLPREMRTELLSENGAGDKTWNMISLSPSMHDLWGRAYFGLKYLRSSEPRGGRVPVQLQFRWLRRAFPGDKPGTVIDPVHEEDFQNCRTSYIFNSGNLRSRDVRFHFSGQPVLSGHVIEVLIPTDDAQKFVYMIKTQWALCKLAAMSAAADYYKDRLNDEDEDQGEEDEDQEEEEDEDPEEEYKSLMGGSDHISAFDTVNGNAPCHNEKIHVINVDLIPGLVHAASAEKQQIMAPTVPEEKQEATVSDAAPAEEQQTAPCPTPQQQQSDATAEETQRDVDMLSPPVHDADERAQHCLQDGSGVPDPTTQEAVNMDHDGGHPAATQVPASQQEIEGFQENEGSQTAIEDVTIREELPQADRRGGALAEPEPEAETQATSGQGTGKGAADIPTEPAQVAESRTGIEEQGGQDGSSAPTEHAEAEEPRTESKELEAERRGDGDDDNAPTEPAQAAGPQAETEKQGGEDGNDGNDAPIQHAQAEITNSTSQPLEENAQGNKQDEDPVDPMAVDAPDSPSSTKALLAVDAPESPPSLTNALLAAIGGLEPAEEEPAGEARASNEGLQIDERDSGQPEWEIDSNPYESSDSSSSDFESDDEPYELLGIDETMKLLIEMEGGSDDEGGKGGKGESSASARTKNEVPDEVIPVPDVTVTAEMKIEELGQVEHVVEGNIVVKAIISGEYQVLDTGSVLCTADRVVIGAVAETLGKVLQPMYTVRFKSEDEIRKLGVEVGTKIFYPVDHALYVFTEPLKAVKGSDASNIHDEEVAVNDMEFSDDEKEAEHKRVTRPPKNRNRNRVDPHPLRQETTINYDDDVDGPYRPLSRPADFGTTSHEPAPRPQHSRGGRRGGGGGGGADRRGRGNWERDQPREGFSLPPQMSQQQRTPPQYPPSSSASWSSAPASAFTWPVPSPWPAHQ
ncbi:hypothetical protein CP532_2725, partial [Ophiocordyceps camponoti-leonardi (nom. inval.)]